MNTFIRVTAFAVALLLALPGLAWIVVVGSARLAWLLAWEILVDLAAELREFVAYLLIPPVTLLVIVGRFVYWLFDVEIKPRKK